MITPFAALVFILAALLASELKPIAPFSGAAKEVARVAKSPARGDIRRVVALGIDGIPEYDARKPFLSLIRHLKRKGYHTLWKGQANKCHTSQPYQLTLPAFASFLTGVVDPRIRNNEFSKELLEITLFDEFPGSQMFSSWAPLLHAMSDDLEIRRRNAYIALRKPAYSTPSDDLIVKAFKKNYRDTPFTLVHLVDADNFAHISPRRRRYLAAVVKTVEYSRGIVDYVEQKTTGSTLFVLFTDHARGRGRRWRNHGRYLPESKNIWMLFASKKPLGIKMPTCDHVGLHTLVSQALQSVQDESSDTVP